MSGRETRLDRLETAFPAPGRKARLCRDCGGLRGDEVLRALDQGDEAADALLVGATDTCEQCGEPTFYGAMAKMIAEDTTA